MTKEVEAKTIEDFMKLPKEELLDLMNVKQRLFCEEWLIDKNGTKAAERAGYGEDNARQTGYEILTKPYIKAYLNILIEEQSERLQITADDVLREIAKLGFANMQDYTKIVDGVLVADLSEVTRDQMAAVQEFTVDVRSERGDAGTTGDNIEKFRFKLADKKGNLELLGRNFKLFTDKTEHTGVDGGPIQTTSSVTFLPVGPDH